MPTKKSNLITEREFVIDSHDVHGRLTWYSPTEHLKNKYTSVLHTEFINTTSSAGDWDGLIIQRHGNSVFVIPFSQENSHYSFALFTGKQIASFPYRNWKNCFLNFRAEYNNQIQ